MTVPTSDSREEYVGNDSTTVFGYAFKIFAATDLEVYLVEGVAQTLQVLGTDYTVSGAGDEGGGDVTMTTAPTSSQKLVILRVIPFTQGTDLRNQGAYYPEAIEDELDRSRMIDQQQQDELGRSLKKAAAGDNYDAQGLRIKDVGDYVDDGDATSFGKMKRYFQQLESGELGDTSRVTANGTSDERNLSAWMEAYLATQAKANTNASNIATNAGDIATNAGDIATNAGDIATNASNIATNASNIATNASNIASLAAVTATAFVKGDGSQPAWTAPTGTTLETSSVIATVVGSTIVEIASGTAVTLPALAAGTDYTLYASDAGALQAVDADSAAPAGERKVGGFHASAGASEIVTNSLWDLNWRPKASPRAMVLVPGGSVWGDIYLTDVGYTNFGYSRNGQTIADGDNRPILPATVGGDGTAVCPSASWWQFLDIFMAAGKRYAIYEELVSLAYGVVERQAVGTDPGTTQHQAGHRSACGAEQITGVMFQWFSGASATGGSGWVSIAEDRGDVYASNLKAPRFGASWNDGSIAGSRASNWSSPPDNSASNIGARALSDHLNLQAER